MLLGLLQGMMHLIIIILAAVVVVAAIAIMRK
jgi:hypothetical protein